MKRVSCLSMPSPPFSRTVFQVGWDGAASPVDVATSGFEKLLLAPLISQLPAVVVPPGIVSVWISTVSAATPQSSRRSLNPEDGAWLSQAPTHSVSSPPLFGLNASWNVVAPSRPAFWSSAQWLELNTDPGCAWPVDVQYSGATVLRSTSEKSSLGSPLLPRSSRTTLFGTERPEWDARIQRRPGSTKLTSTQLAPQAFVAAGRAGMRAVALAATADMPIVAATATPAAIA